MNELNPNWVSAPYRVDFLFWCPLPPANWARKRRLKWSRRKRKTESKKFNIHPAHYRGKFKAEEYRGELWTPPKKVLWTFQ